MLLVFALSCGYMAYLSFTTSSSPHPHKRGRNRKRQKGACRQSKTKRDTVANTETGVVKKSDRERERGRRYRDGKVRTETRDTARETARAWLHFISLLFDFLNLRFSWTQALCSMLCLKLVCYFFSCFQAEYWGPGNECITVVYLSGACTEGSLVVPTSTTELPSVHAPLCWGCRKRCCSKSWQNPIWLRINIPTTPQDRRGVY